MEHIKEEEKQIMIKQVEHHLELVDELLTDLGNNGGWKEGSYFARVSDFVNWTKEYMTDLKYQSWYKSK